MKKLINLYLLLLSKMILLLDLEHFENNIGLKK